MIEIYKFNPFEMLAFILIFLRIASCFAAWPVLGSENVPPHAKILASLVLSFVVFPLVGWKKLGVGIDSNLIVFLSLKEVFIGLFMGLVARFFFFAVSICGEIVSLTIGISADQMFNPAMGHRSTIIEQYYVMLATMIFLGINGHHLLISGLVRSFDIAPLTVHGLSFGLFQHTGLLIQEMMIAGIRMAAPVLASVFFMNVALGLLSRATPQVNILVTSLAVNVMLGVCVIFISIPLGVETMGLLVQEMSSRVLELIGAF